MHKKEYWNFIVIIVSTFFSSLIEGFLRWYMPKLAMNVSLTYLVMTYSVSYTITILAIFIGGILADIFNRKYIVMLSYFNIALILTFLAYFFNSFLLTMFIIIYITVPMLYRSSLKALIANIGIMLNGTAKVYSITLAVTYIGMSIGSIYLAAFQTLYQSLKVSLFFAWFSFFIFATFKYNKDGTLHKNDTKLNIYQSMNLIIRNFVELSQKHSPILILMVLWGIGGGVNASFLPNYLSNVIGLTDIQLGTIFSTTYVLQASLYVIAGYLVNIMGYKKGLFLNVVLMSVFCVLISFKPIVFSYTAIYVMTIATMIGNTALFTYIANTINKNSYGRAYGYFEAIWFSSSILGVMLGGILWNFNNEFLFTYLLPIFLIQIFIVKKLKT